MSGPPVSRLVAPVASGPKPTTASSPSSKAADDAKLRKACKDFESIFVGMLLKGMRKTVPDSGLLESSEGDTYQDMLDDEYAKAISATGRMGLGDALYRDLTRTAAAKGGGGTAKGK